jgi:hypothetical protein
MGYEASAEEIFLAALPLSERPRKGARALADAEGGTGHGGECNLTSVFPQEAVALKNRIASHVLCNLPQTHSSAFHPRALLPPAGISPAFEYSIGAYSVTCCFVYPRSAQIAMAGLDPAIHENTVIANLSN